MEFSYFIIQSPGEKYLTTPKLNFPKMFMGFRKPSLRKRFCDAPEEVPGYLQETGTTSLFGR